MGGLCPCAVLGWDRIAPIASMLADEPAAQTRTSDEVPLFNTSYDHRSIEARWSAEWERESLFEADPKSNRPKFSLVLLPPSVSARMHLGHTLQSIVQDVLVRYRRMAGF